MDKKVQDILSKMTLEDKISLCNGADFWHSKAMAQYGIPAVTMSDGPHGVRCQKNGSDMLGVNESEPATCFPTAVTSGAGVCIRLDRCGPGPLRWLYAPPAPRPQKSGT